MTPELNKIYPGDCLEVMRSWPDNFVDSIITDPPYGLSFMGKDWDHGVPGTPFWLEAFRIAKPGTMLLAFGGTRTYHRLAVAIEDAGWQVRDCLMWLYGSGFPKSLDISKMIDASKGAEREVIGTKKGSKGAPGTGYENSMPGKAVGIKHITVDIDITAPATEEAKLWDGWGTGLKPAWEPILVAMKPLESTYAENAERWGVAGMHIEGTRIGAEKRINQPMGAPGNSYGGYSGDVPASAAEVNGRWPANVIIDEEAAEMLDKQSGAVGGLDDLGEWGGASRFFYIAKTGPSERNEGLEEMPKVSCGVGALGDNGRGKWAQNHHPTVKPVELMKYLCALTKTPTGGIVLDPFCGSGTTLWAAESHNRPWLGIEKNLEYVQIAQARIAREQAQLKLPLEAMA